MRMPGDEFWTFYRYADSEEEARKAVKNLRSSASVAAYNYRPLDPTERAHKKQNDEYRRVRSVREKS